MAADGKQSKETKKISIWLRLALLLVLVLLAFIGGTMAGYGGLGGLNPFDALKWSTWQHIIDLVEKKT
nr:DNA-directed RNA polymerase subunit beta [Metabacillus kandeliae]